jgi:hypothetical protein
MQYTSAEAGNVTMQIWLGKQWLGQTDKNQIKQETTLTVDEALVDQIKNMDFDNIIALGKGLDKLEGQ